MRAPSTFAALLRPLVAFGNAGAAANAARACEARLRSEEATDAALRAIATRSPAPPVALPRPA